MNDNMPKVTFGIVNCNRLHYLKSCLESLLFCTEDYSNKEIIIVDNASIEEGTEEYLAEKESQGFKVIRQPERDPSNEFAKALNIICREATGEIIAPLQGDMQFILKEGWLEKYVELFLANDQNIGCITLDAQRRITNNSHQYSNVLKIKDFGFVADGNRPAASGAADVMYRKSVLEMMYPWSEVNSAHEGGGDSETKMLEKINKLTKDNNLNLFTIMPIFPPAVAIYTDARGTNARVRGNRRYGDYWPPKQDFRYYEILNYSSVIKKIEGLTIPVAIEDVAIGIDFQVSKDTTGNWLKNSIDPDTAAPGDYVELGYSEPKISKVLNVQEEYLDSWLEDDE